MAKETEASGKLLTVIIFCDIEVQSQIHQITRGGAT
jgi:hypothetical protein